MRFESENWVSDQADWAPRLGIAWAPGHSANPKTVVRAGGGLFYERFDDDQMIIAERLNGQNQLSYVVNQPDVLIPLRLQLPRSGGRAPTRFQRSIASRPISVPLTTWISLPAWSAS